MFNSGQDYAITCKFEYDWTDTSYSTMTNETFSQPSLALACTHSFNECFLRSPTEMNWCSQSIKSLFPVDKNLAAFISLKVIPPAVIIADLPTCNCTLNKYLSTGESILLFPPTVYVITRNTKTKSNNLREELWAAVSSYYKPNLWLACKSRSWNMCLDSS